MEAFFHFMFHDKVKQIAGFSQFFNLNLFLELSQKNAPSFKCYILAANQNFAEYEEKH